jgi:hypothetical protein
LLHKGIVCNVKKSESEPYLLGLASELFLRNMARNRQTVVAAKFGVEGREGNAL